MAEITVSDRRWAPAKEWRKLIVTVQKACARKFPSEMEGREISVLLCGDAQIKTLNSRWRGIDKATNVLSFPTAGAAGPHVPLGDIAIAWDTVMRESAQENKSVQHHVSHLVVHGVLHLLGFDHEVPDDAERMEQEEREILSMLGIADPYRSLGPPVEPTRRPHAV